jgi:ferri-bacillibactin esterase
MSEIGPPALGVTEVHDLWSDAVQDTFRVFVGRCGPEPEVVLFVTDGNGLFGLAVDTIRMMQIPALLPSMLVVAVGYPNAETLADTIAIRGRDLTPTPASWLPASGGAWAFIRFLRTELFPWVTARQPAAMATKLYFGHSLGGLFGTYVLLSEPDAFDGYVISSPSLWWEHHAPAAWEGARAADHDDLAARAYFGIGALETDAGRRLEGTNLPDGHVFKPVATRLDMVADLLRFTAALRRRGYPSLDVVGVDVFHATAPGTVLSHGLRRLLVR